MRVGEERSSQHALCIEEEEGSYLTMFLPIAHGAAVLAYGHVMTAGWKFL